MWRVPGSKNTVKEKWEAVHKDLEEEPHVRVFGKMKRSAIESHFDHLVRDQSKTNSEATQASGSANTSADELTEDEGNLVRIKLSQAVLGFQ